MLAEIACALATGNRALLRGASGGDFVEALPAELRERVAVAAAGDRCDAALADREGVALTGLLAELARRDGPIVPVFRVSVERLRRGEAPPLDFLLSERSLSVNTTAAGGNASLMTIG